MDNKETTYSIDFYNINSEQTTTQNLVVTEGRHPTNQNVVWNCDFNFRGKTIFVKDEYYLSGVINRIREVVEPLGYRTLVVCSDLDAHHSRMQADMTNGAMIYKTNQKNEDGSFLSFPVFEKSTGNDVSTLEEQKKFNREYHKTSNRERQKPIPWHKKFFK